jgi:hypothetical protein
MLHFSGDLAETKIPGARWDDGVDRADAAVPQYAGPASYLALTTTITRAPAPETA